MTRLKNFLAKNKEVLFLGVVVFAIIIVEGFVFNREFVSSYFLGPQERRYSVNDSVLSQFSLENGNLIAQNADPNITFSNMNLLVSSISINCNNSMAGTPGAFGQIFYTGNSNEPFSEANSIRYNLSLSNKTFVLPAFQMVYSLRFDLTNIPHDSISCSDFVIKYRPAFEFSIKRLAIYLGLLLLALLFIVIRSINPVKDIPQNISSESRELSKREGDALLATRTFIRAEHISVRFRIYHNPIPSLKDLVVNQFSGKKNRDNFTEFFALNDISLTIRPGERLGIVGLNGAGKSTLLKTIAGIYAPHQGRIAVKGRMTPLMELGAGFDLEQTGRENVFLNGALLGFSPTQMREKEQAIAEFSELGEFLDLPVKYYSTGMYGRLAFSIATMTNPEILLMDEVFATGDAHFVEKSSQRILQLVEQSQIVIIVSHSMDQISKLCNRVILMNKGAIIKDGSPKEVLAYYAETIINQ